MRSLRSLMLVASIALCSDLTPARADDERFAHNPVVIDTDMGIDDAVTLALALQAHDVDVEAIVATGGVQSAERAAELAARLAEHLLRTDVAIYRGREPKLLPGAAPIPPFRAVAERAVSSALPNASNVTLRAFSPLAYSAPEGRVRVLALGPLSSLAAALAERPEIADAIDAVIMPMESTVVPGWNVDRDGDAMRAVRESGVRVVGIARGADVSSIADALLPAPPRPAPSLAQRFARALLADEATRAHYLARPLHDELALAYARDIRPFVRRAEDDLLEPQDGASAVLARIATLGRQEREMVLFADIVLPKSALNDTLRQRRDAMIEKNGETEWIAQVLLNEVHQHLGAFSIIGAKMALRGAELLNAPQHSMRAVSHAPAAQPMACLDDGLIVGAGSTPGRLLFTKESAAGSGIAASFEYGGRRVRLELKPEYGAKIRGRIASLLERYSLEHHGYWEGVADFGLEIWEDWHRAEIFVESSVASIPQEVPAPR